MLRGVINVSPGYAGGENPNPPYEEVSSGTTGHAEVIRIDYDSTKISYQNLLTVFFGSHDPTTMNRQGNDRGTQYRSIILTTNDEQADVAHAFIKELNASHKDGAPVVTEVRSLEQFYNAEDYHQNYYANNRQQGYCQIVINPKLEKVQKQFAALLNEEAKQK